jgi:hypothetical protein
MFLSSHTLMNSLTEQLLQPEELMRSTAMTSLDVSCLMLATMSPDLQKQYEHADAHSMIGELRGMFENQATAERYNISKSLFACKLEEGSPVSPHVIKIIGYIETLEKLGSELKPDLAIDVILQLLAMSLLS